MLLLPYQERAPGNGLPGLPSVGVEIVDLEVILQGLLIILLLDIAMANVHLHRQVVGLYLFGPMIIRESHLGLFQIPVAGGYAPDGPEVVGGDNLGLEESLERLGIVALLLVAETYLLVYLGIGVIGSREAFEEFKRIVVISAAEIILADEPQTVLPAQQRLERRDMQQVEGR